MAIAKYGLSKHPDRLLKRIHEAFPELSWVSYEIVTKGWDHVIVILDSSIVFRFPNDAAYLAALSYEVGVLGVLKPLIRATIPSYSYIAADFSFAGYPIIPGRFVSKQLYRSMSLKQRNSMVSQLAELLSTMHNLTRQGYEFDAVPLSYITKDQKHIKQTVTKYLPEKLTKQELTEVQNILAAVDRLVAQPLPPVLIHGDMYSRHLLWEKSNRRLGVIDFSDMVIGDPAIDFAELFEYGEAFVGDLYKRYTGPKDETFLERSKLYQRWISVYMMTDHFDYHKTSFEVARKLFDSLQNHS